MTRWTTLLSAGLVTTLVLGAWTIRAAAPDRDADRSNEHFLPMSGDRLFTLVGGPGARYEVRDGDLACDREQIAVGDELRCGSARMFLRTQAGHHRLLFGGLAVELPSTVGSGRDADHVLPVPGIGARHLELLPIDRCENAVEVPELPVVCVRNGGASGALIVDRSARRSTDKPLSAVRRSVRHGESVLVDERDLLWVAHVPLRVRTDDGLLLLSVPDEQWTTLGGDRRWMAMELPAWRLSADDATAREHHVFRSREALFETGANPLAVQTNMVDSRVEYEQEEKLQAFIDHEMLCLSPDGRSLAWNLVTGRGCDGSQIPAPPAAMWRAAELSAYQPGVRQILDGAADELAGLPERTPDPAGMVFVFDWAFEETADGELRRVPTRVLGVRPGSTRNGPPIRREVIAGDDACAVAKSGRARPPIDARHGTTSAWLEVVEDGGLARGTVLLLPGSRRPGAAGPLGAVCAWTGKKPPPGASRVDPAASGKAAPLPEAFTLGQLHVRTDAKAGVVAYAAASPVAELPDGADGACATVYLGVEGFTVLVDGDPNQVRIGETLAEQRNIPLVDGARVRVGDPSDPVDLVFHAPAFADHLAFDAVADGHVDRHYPFGALASPVTGFGALAGGVEGAGTSELWEAAGDTWRKDACDKKPGEGGIELTLDGDLQRIVSAELAAIAAACSTGDARCSPKGDAVSASAVLLDSATGDVLAVGNWPAFDPSDAEAVEGLRRELRLAGPGGSIQIPDLENEAFLRAKNAGSAYKLATSYALARTGRLGPSAAAPPEYACTRFTWYSPRPHDEDGPRLLAPGFPPDGARSQPCGKRAVVLSDAAAGYHDAFRHSVNLYFGLAPFAVLEGSGVDYSAPRHVSTLRDPLENPLGEGSGLWSWDHDGRADLGVALAPGFDVARDLTDENPFLDVLVATGHRYHYPRVGGGVLYTQHADAVGTRAFPTSTTPWLPGLRTGSGYRYPSLVGPEAYAVEGVPRWSERDLVLPIRTGEATSNVAITAGTSSIREYSRVGYGMGGVEASALSLAVLATPMARVDGSVVAPELILSPQLMPHGRIVSNALVRGEGRAEIERAMRAVVSEKGSTAHGYFSEEVGARIGGKTGTFEIARMTSDAKFADAKSWQSIEAIVRHGCDVRGPEPTAEDWQRFRTTFDKRAARKRSSLDQRPWVKDGFAELTGSPPARGFAASADVCVDWGLRPGRPGVGGVVAGVDGGAWLDGAIGVFPLDREDEELVEGSSFVAVVFDGLVDPTTPGAPAPGKGYVLAVIVDGHGTGAKRAAARILERVRQHLLVEQALGLR